MSSLGLSFDDTEVHELSVNGVLCRKWERLGLVLAVPVLSTVVCCASIGLKSSGAVVEDGVGIVGRGILSFRLDRDAKLRRSLRFSSLSCFTVLSILSIYPLGTLRCLSLSAWRQGARAFSHALHWGMRRSHLVLRAWHRSQACMSMGLAQSMREAERTVYKRQSGSLIQE